MPTYNYRCEKHGLFSETCPYEVRDEAKSCPLCPPGPLWPRTWEQSAPAINTSDSATIPEMVAKGRFAGVRASRVLEKAEKKAVKEKNREELKKILVEKVKLSRS